MPSASIFPASNRPVAMGVNGMVASAHPLASQSGVRMLMAGGSFRRRRRDRGHPERR